ncbi:hypothetical protein T03_8327 [Trichinella britovi]|uniref:Uncharacterized protein n=1 Tax=Trichinella britovi TaxID=45882 RepID=A0A0V1CBT4_TRIBR|nr:hypothetical protein T03_8327 [Trichinella britovi]
MSWMGEASGHMVNLSMAVKRYLKPSDCGSGTTMSRWTCSKRCAGGKNSASGEGVCRCILARWQLVHARVHRTTSPLMPSHTYLAVIRRFVARMPGCDRSWMAQNVGLRSGAGNFKDVVCTILCSSGPTLWALATSAATGWCSVAERSALTLCERASATTLLPPPMWRTSSNGALAYANQSSSGASRGHLDCLKVEGRSEPAASGRCRSRIFVLPPRDGSIWLPDMLLVTPVRRRCSASVLRPGALKRMRATAKSFSQAAGHRDVGYGVFGGVECLQLVMCQGDLRRCCGRCNGVQGD